MQKILPLNPFTNVVASGIATCDMVTVFGNSLEAINLTLGGTTFTKAMITLIQIKANGKVVFETDGTKLEASESFKNNTSDATHLCINFMENKARTLNALQSGAWNVAPDSGITSLRMEVTISGATAPTLAATAELNSGLPAASEAAIRPLMHRRHRSQQTIATAGQKTALSVPHIDPAGGGSVFKRICIYSANLTSIQVVRDGLPDYDISVADLQQIQKKAGRVPQANLTVFDPLLDNVMTDRLWDTRPVAGHTQAIFYGVFSGAEAITIETEELIPFSFY